MKLLSSFLVAINADLTSNDTSDTAQCGANLDPTIVEECQNKAILNDESWEPPLCGSDSACRAAENDPCSFSCVKKVNCPDTVYEYYIGDQLYCDCTGSNDPPRFDMYWSCDNTGYGFYKKFYLLTISDCEIVSLILKCISQSKEVEGTKHQHGFARVPAIQRDSDKDVRQITLMSGMENDSKWFETDVSEMIFQDGKLELFGNNNCIGASNSTEELEYVEFRDLFNHPECQPACQTIEIDDHVYEECRIIVGYNDLFHTLGRSGQRVRLQTGEYWDFTCSRKLTGDANDNGVVNATSNEPDDYRKVVETDFNVDIMCCDPADDSCKQCSTNATPILHIGPNADPKSSFFVDINFDNDGYEHKNEYLHIDQCTYTEYDENEIEMGEPLELIKDGCDETFGLIKFKERTVEKKNYEQFFLKPFQIENQIANRFNVNCELRVCRNGDSDCGLGESCSSRYDVFDLDSNQTTPVPARRRRDTDSLVNVSVGGVHPCTYVSEGINVCIVEPGQEVSNESCWTNEKCGDPELRKLDTFPPRDHEETPSDSTADLVAGMALLLSFV